MSDFAKKTNENSVENNANKQNVVELYSLTPKNRVLLNILITFGVCFTFVIFVFQILLVPISIEGESMQPTINNDYSAITKANHRDIVYYFNSGNYSYGDIVIINNTADNDTIIKRVIAVGGDTITFNLLPGTEKTEKHPLTHLDYIASMEMEIVITNSSGTYTLVENYIKEDMVFEFIVEDINGQTLGKYKEYKKMDETFKNPSNNLSYSITLPENTYYCLGDNRNLSKDSRCYGYFSKSQILGEVVLHIPYGKNIFYAIWNAIF